ncbi:MAG: hypothetical protein DRJ66_07510 [Thermoprotei archaeon]|nr:MAG: hypothetical protein DRJ66_07510 [Thermoprotei archaeon]
MLSGLAYRLFRGLARRLEGKFKGYRVVYERSGLTEPFPIYLSVIILYTLIAFIASLTGSTLLGVIIIKDIKLTLLYSLILSVFISLFICLIMLLYPIYRASSRKYVIDSELIYTVGEMAILAAAGIAPYRIIEEMVKVEENREIKLELKKILRNMRIAGDDISSALIKASEGSPSDKLRMLWDGMRNTLLMSGNLWEYLYHVYENLIADKIASVKQATSTLNVLSEAYAGIMILLPLTLVITLTMMSAIGGYVLGVNPLTLLVILLILILPAVGIIAYLLVDSILTRI